MAGNKFDTAFKVHKAERVEIRLKDVYGDPMKFEGTPQQAINFLIKLI